MKRWIWAMATVLLAQSAFAGTGSQLHGVWKGTIGTLPVQACFNADDSYNFGAYFYMSQLKIIHLEEKQGGADWSEGDAAGSPVWHLEPPNDDTLAGTWQGEAKKLPIALTRIAVTDDESERPCGARAFMAPRLTPPKITETPAKLDGTAYTKIEVDVGKHFEVSIKGFKLHGATPGITKINKALTAIIPAAAPGSEYAECMAANLASIGHDGDFFVELSPIVLTRHWLVARWSQGGTCGGAHPSHGSEDKVYDLKTGGETNVATWLAPSAIKNDSEGQYNPAGPLRIMILKALTLDNAGCKDPIENADFWAVALSREGVTFTPSLAHAVQACEDSTAIPFATARKFMTRKGRAKLKSFEGELKN